MDLITTKQKMLESLKNVLSVETSEKNSYQKDMIIFENEKIKASIKKIRNDEINHIKILKKTH